MVNENPYKAPVEKDTTPLSPEPQNEKFWTVTFYIGAFFWIVSTGGMIFVGLGYDDQWSPDKDQLRWMAMAAEWILGGASTLVAAMKLRRPPAVDRGLRDTIRAWLSFIVGSLVAVAIGAGLAALVSLFINP